MKKQTASPLSKSVDRKLAAYLAAAGAVLASNADAEVVSNTTVQPFGINEEVDIDFNMDGQIDFQIDHDRVDLNGNILDYLQIDKNDVNGASAGESVFSLNPMGGSFPIGTTTANDTQDSKYVTIGDSSNYLYPAALDAGTAIGPDSRFPHLATASSAEIFRSLCRLRPRCLSRRALCCCFH